MKLKKTLICLIALSGLLSGIAPLQAQTDLLKILKNYADAMIEHGRDDARYGDQTSPLFAVMLQRDTETPVMLPYPQIPILKNSEPGHRWKFDYSENKNFINIPFLEGEKLHKLTVAGEDVMEHYGLYRTLFLLTELSGDPAYKNAADEALTWWYENTQGPSGLFPWGEHLGWDFRYDYITYHVKGHEDFYNNPKYDYENTPQEQWAEKFTPITQLYQAFQHEPRTPDLSAEILLENLKSLPLEKGETFTPLEKFAFGCWKEHVIDLDSGGYNRHGDYFGRRWGVEGRYAGTGNFPRIIGLFFDYWSYTWMHTSNPVVADSLENIIDIMLDDLLSDIDDRGIIHDFYYQTWKAAAGAVVASKRLAGENPALSEKLQQFADGQVTALYGAWSGGYNFGRNMDNKNISALTNLEFMMTLWFASQREDLKPILKEEFDGLYEVNADSLTTASGFANHIRFMVFAHQIFKEEKYILKAEAFVGQALDKMFDDYSPLPRINTSDTLYSGDGTGYANFYHAPGGSDDLMWALALFAQEVAR
jgi:hypothetical protein